MKKYNITVNGKTYEVELEEIGGVGTGSFIAPSKPNVSKTAPRKATPRKAVPRNAAPKAAPASGAGSISAPMPGTVLDIKVTQGQEVKAGDILLILEAMKMENEIVAPTDGKVSKIDTTKGAAVNTGDALITLS